MRRRHLLFCAFALAACAVPGDPSVSVLAIADGVEITDTLEVVAIQRFTASGEYLCSGTVIGPYHVLTARHCVADGASYEMVSDPSRFEVLVTARIDVPRSIRARHRVARVHPYGGERAEFAYEGRDIAVLITETRLAPPPRRLADGDPAEGSSIEIIGFGRNGEAASVSAGVKRRGATIVERVVGFDPSPYPVYSGIITAVGGANGVCAGDSGGPAFDATGALVGVTSLGAFYCRAGGGGVFMSTHASRAFIQDALAIYPGCTEGDPRDGCTTTPVLALGEASTVVADGLGVELAVEAGGRVLAADRYSLYLLEEAAGTWTAAEMWSALARPVVSIANGRAAAAGGIEVAVWEPGSWFTPDATITVVGPTVRAIATAGDLIVVGAPYEGSGTGTGVAHVLRRSATIWALETTITSSERSFGAAIATDGVRIAVGAPLADGERAGEGSVHLYAEDGAGWAEQARLVASDPGAHDHFGTALAMGAGVLAVGAPGEDGAGGDSGAVYVFTLEASGATELQRLYPIDGSGLRGDFGNLLGTDVELSADGSRLVAGAPGDRRAGAVYLFGARPGGGFGLVDRIGPRAGALGQRFGERVGVDSDRVLAAAPERVEATTGILGVVAAFSVAGTCGTPMTEPTPCEAPIEPDAGMPSLDAGRRDAGPPPARDAAVTPDTGPDVPPPSGAGCGCAVPSRAARSALPLVALLPLAAIALGARTQRLRSRRLRVRAIRIAVTLSRGSQLKARR